MTRELSFENKLLGQTIAGKYRLLEIQASGAFGTVFRAHQFFCDVFMRPVAVKVSRQAGLTVETAPHLFGDALVLARLLAEEDPRGDDGSGRRHLVQIFDMGLLSEHEGRAYLAMEYVEGLPLLAHLRAAGRVGVATGLRLIKQICRAVALVHAGGAVHRDLKADNILVDRRGVARVVDFGLAAFADTRLGFAPGAMGTFTYMAPETVFGRSTQASDVYSLGLLMYELFTGAGPHLTAAWNIEENKDRRHDHWEIKRTFRFAPPSESHNEIRFDFRWLDEIILRCLEFDPGLRFPDAGKLLAALEACEAGEPLPAAERWTTERWEQDAPPAPPERDAESDCLFRDARRLLAQLAFDQAINRLDVHRPADWEAMGLREARTLRLLGQAFLGKMDLPAARECLEQLRAAQRELPLLEDNDYAAALTDLVKCYHGLGMADLAEACRQEAHDLAKQANPP
jgi:serine/threonine protein kinase